MGLLVAVITIDVVMRSTVGRLLAAPVERVLVDEHDDVTWLAHRLSTWQAPPAPGVLVLGGSAIREATWTEDEMTRRLSAAGWPGARFDHLGSSSQTMAESLAIYDAVELPRGSVVLLHATPGRLGTTWDEVLETDRRPRIPGLRSSALRRTLDAHDSMVLPVWDVQRAASWLAAGQFAARGLDRAHGVLRLLTPVSRATCGFGVGCVRMVSSLVSTDAATSWSPHRYTGLAPRPDLAASNVDALRETTLSWFAEDASPTEHLLGAFSRLAAERGHMVVLVELPLHPLAREASNEVEPAWALLLDDLVAAPHVRVVRISDEAVRVGGGFYDHAHVTDAGRAELAPILLNLASDALSEAAHRAELHHGQPD